MRTVVSGTGIHVPANVIDNERLSLLMETDDAWIRQRTGIRERRYADLGQATSDLAVPAAQAALADAGLDLSDVDYVIFATMTPDHYFPGAGPVFQRKLGLGPVGVLDIRQQCSGFLYGMQLADALIRSGQHRNVMLVGAEVHGGFMPWTSWDVALGKAPGPVPREEYERNTRFRNRTVLFGDAAGVFILSAENRRGGGLEDVQVRADGRFVDKMFVPCGGSARRHYFTPEDYASGDTVPVVEGPDVFKMAVVKMPEAVEGILARNGYTLDDVRLVVMHQANLRINEAVQKRLGLPDERVFNNIERYGNTTAATLPLAFHEAKTERGLQEGDLVCFVALGSGLTWGAALYRL